MPHASSSRSSRPSDSNRGESDRNASSQSGKVSIPTPEADQPRLAQVGVIAAVCFAIGVLWPTLSGVKLVHDAPSKQVPKAEPKPRRAEPAQDPEQSVPVAKVVAQAPKKTSEATVQIQEVIVVNCRDDGDRRLSSCDTPAFDDIAGDLIEPFKRRFAKGEIK